LELGIDEEGDAEPAGDDPNPPHADDGNRVSPHALLSVR